MSSMHSHSIASRALPAIAATTVFAGVFSVNAAPPDPKVLIFTPPDKINWTGNDGGAKTSDPGGRSVQARPLRRADQVVPHHMSHPHFHPNDRYIYVISGTWWVGTGSKYDPDSTTPMPAGSFVTHYGKQIHYDGAKDEEVTLEIVGMGPATSTPAEVK